MRFGLSNSVIHAIQHVLAKYPHVQKAMIYGSRAKGNYKSGSDIDLTLMGSSISEEDFSHIMQDLYELPIPHTIDLSLFVHIKNHDLIEHINRVGMLFYEK